MTQTMLDRLRRRIAWWLMPADKENLRKRFRLVERDLFGGVGRRQLAYIQRQLGINRWEKPEPENMDPEEYPTAPETIFDPKDAVLHAEPPEMGETYVSESHEWEVENEY